MGGPLDLDTLDESTLTAGALENIRSHDAELPDDGLSLLEGDRRWLLCYADTLIARQKALEAALRTAAMEAHSAAGHYHKSGLPFPRCDMSPCEQARAALALAQEAP